MLILHYLVLMYAHEFLFLGTYASVEDCKMFLHRHRSPLASLPKGSQGGCLRAVKGRPLSPRVTRRLPTCNVGSPSPKGKAFLGWWEYHRN